MMLGLGLNVGDCVVNLRYADAEGTISFLPREVAMLGECFVNPF
jgi:hypothetical protein